MSLLRYFDGATPKRKPKNTPTDTEKKENQKTYEINRKRKFQASWTKDRPWLSYNEDEGTLTCTVCQKFSKDDADNAFVRGTKYMRIDGIKAHESSECNIRSRNKQSAQDNPVHQSVASKALVALKKADHDKLVIKMRNAHACAKHSLSFRTYNLMCRLDKMKNLDVGSQYLSDKAGANFCESIAKTTRCHVISKVKECTWCSMSCDGSTDFTGEDMEAVYVRTCTCGKIEDLFLHLGSSESSCSEDIFKFLMETLRTMGLEDTMKTKLVGFCADGASNMQGLNRGVTALLKKQWPCLVTTHCLLHRLELAFKDAVKIASPKLYEKATTLLLGIYYLFRKSPKQKKGLQRAFQALGERQLLPTRIGGTRWLPHYMRAITIFLKTYKVLRYQLENSSNNNAKAEGLARILRDGHVIVYIIGLKRIIFNLQNLSLYLQKDNLSLSDAYTRVESSKQTLLQLLDREDQSFSVVLNTEMFNNEKLVFKGQKNADSNYGEEEVAVLFNHFSPIVFPSNDATLECVTDEWSTLKSLVYLKFSPKELKEYLTWEHLFIDFADQNLSHIFNLIEAVLALPPTSVKCETAFSAMKLLKTKRRGRLGNAHLNDLMTVKIMSPSIEEFDPTPALSAWMMSTPSGQKRRVGEKSVKEGIQSNRGVPVSAAAESQTVDLDSDGLEETNENVFESQAHANLQILDDDKDNDSGSGSDDDMEMEMSEDVVFDLIRRDYDDDE